LARRIQPIFDSILADDRLLGSSRSFVESLQEQYTRKKTLSQGQRHALGRIEAQLASAPEIDVGEQNRLDSLISRAGAANDRWAVTFITSLKGQLSMGRELSPRQTEILKKVEDRHSDKAQAMRESWASNFSSEMREKLTIAARYYLANPPYFGDIAKKALEDDSYVPSERSYRKMVENKYATKVIESTLAEPKFNAGSHVAIRKTASIGLHSTRRTNGVVLKVDAAPVTSAARGSKVYSVLFFGDSKATLIEERWLKKGKA
tara:strand:- start:299 stop:1084 length:786 start_codon:yes stop_codon:yes gene_type:complete